MFWTLLLIICGSIFSWIIVKLLGLDFSMYIYFPSEGIIITAVIVTISILIGFGIDVCTKSY